MKNTKLIQLLQTFTQWEINEFGKFIYSPFHNESLKMIKLYDILKKYYPDFDNKKLTKENIFYAIYEDKKLKFDDKKLRERFSDLLKLAEEFLAVNSLKKAPFDSKLKTLKEYKERKLVTHFEKKYKEAESILNEVQGKNEIDFANELILFEQKVEFYENKQSLGKRKEFFENVEVSFELVLRYAVTKILRLYAYMKHIEGHINYKYDYKLYEPIVKFAEENIFNDSVITKALCLILKLHVSDDLAPYMELKKLYIENYKTLTDDDASMIITELYNCATLRSPTNPDKFKKERFKLIKLQLAHNTYPKENGCMKRETFFINVKVGLGFDIKWTEKFITDYKDKIVSDQRESTYRYNSAVLHFTKKEFNAALTELSKIKNSDYFYYVMVKTLLCKIYFDLNEMENVLLGIDSFKHFLSGNNFIPLYVKKGYEKFLEFLNRTVQLTFNYDGFKLFNLKNEIEITSPEFVYEKGWLLDKVNQIKEK